MCDYAVGLSRQLNGSVIPSERKIMLLLLISLLSSLCLRFRNLVSSVPYSITFQHEHNHIMIH